MVRRGKPDDVSDLADPQITADQERRGAFQPGQTGTFERPQIQVPAKEPTERYSGETWAALASAVKVIGKGGSCARACRIACSVFWIAAGKFSNGSKATAVWLARNPRNINVTAGSSIAEFAVD